MGGRRGGLLLSTAKSKRCTPLSSYSNHCFKLHSHNTPLPPIQTLHLHDFTMAAAVCSIDGASRRALDADTPITPPPIAAEDAVNLLRKKARDAQELAWAALDAAYAEQDSAWATALLDAAKPYARRPENLHTHITARANRSVDMEMRRVEMAHRREAMTLILQSTL